MLIKVLFFARLKDQLGQSAVTIELTNGGDTATLKQQLLSLGSRWTALQDPALLMAVNHQHVNHDVALHAGDEVAFFPPVTGG
ncbi:MULTISPECIES: molybdopterin converting factor subunit 1 [unclassified Agarivorans]|uniref:molybdopterin converting factor subunit 1 n=1 Tax=unclassified Agarivorans TaxID=2636026 RepID=UPI003D7C6BBA